jgi:hypothetical protein
MKFAIVTPSYYKDFPRCQLLAESVEKYIPADIPYYILVGREDEALFSTLKSKRIQIVLEEDVVGLKTRRLAWAPRWRVSWRTLPVRGWIWQQIVKLSMSQMIPADAYMIMDSDCMFFRPFDPRSLIDREGRIPLYREEKSFYTTDSDTQKWHKHGGKILKIPRPQVPYATGYVGAPIFWRRDVLGQLRNHMDMRNFLTVASRISLCPTFSEYVLYGMFVEHILGIEASGHYKFHGELAQNHWTETALDVDQLNIFKRNAPSEKVMIHINAKSGTSVGDIRQVFATTLNNV